jgi:hypothetical protein
VLAVVVAAVVVLRPDGGPPHPDEWDPRVADLAAFVAAERGLGFEHPVHVDFLTHDEYSDAVRVDRGALTDEDRAEMDGAVATLRALGLASGEVDLFDAGNDLVDGGTLAFYHPGRERITVRGTELTVDVEVTLVHEMTHALQDQHFDLDRIQREIYAGTDLAAAAGDPADDPDDPDGEAGLAASAATAAFAGYQALIEGDAVRIENAYVESLSDRDLEDYVSSFRQALEQADADLGEVPAAMRAFQAAPYVLGQPLVDLVAADGGNAGVDEMFDDHPTTEEHLLDPLTYVARERPTELPLPNPAEAAGDDAEAEAEAEVIDQGTMGAVELYVVLAERIDPHVALDAADGWAGATFVSYEAGDRTCVRVLVDGDTTEDDRQLRSALTAWVQAAPAATDASVQDLGPGRTQVESCDPGTAGAAGNERALDVLTVPAVRSQVTFFEVDAGADLEAAWTAGDCFVHELTFDQLVTINELTTDPPPDLQAVIDTAFATCAPA